MTWNEDKLLGYQRRMVAGAEVHVAYSVEEAKEILG
jgi:hypothetical protein